MRNKKSGIILVLSAAVGSLLSPRRCEGLRSPLVTDDQLARYGRTTGSLPVSPVVCSFLEPRPDGALNQTPILSAFIQLKVYALPESAIPDSSGGYRRIGEEEGRDLRKGRANWVIAD